MLRRGEQEMLSSSQHDKRVVRSHRDLVVWHLSLEMVNQVYAVTARFPDSEKWGLVAQLRRAAVSVPSNIAEGSARGRSREFVHSLRIARGSLAEVETQLRIAAGLGYLRESSDLAQLIERLERMLNALLAALRQRAVQRRHPQRVSGMPARSDSANFVAQSPVDDPPIR
jgi:four helix bundle protein